MAQVKDKQAIPQIPMAGFSALIVFIPILAVETSLTILFNLSMVFTDSGVLNSTSKTENAIRRSHVIVGLIVTKIKVKPVRQLGLRIRTAPHAFRRMRRREYT